MEEGLVRGILTSSDDLISAFGSAPFSMNPLINPKFSDLVTAEKMLASPKLKSAACEAVGSIIKEKQINEKMIKDGFLIIGLIGPYFIV